MFYILSGDNGYSRQREGVDSTYSAVSTVSASPLLGSLVDLNVLDEEVAGIEAFGIGIGLGVLEQIEKELGGLDRPAGLGDTELLACGGFKSVLTLSQFPSSTPILNLPSQV
jgi:hypothetical protein